ncbi:hypothetical protein MMC25_001211 [Agyrium rufum]|nr:hypothetical protein [Agyrium rufum]
MPPSHPPSRSESGEERANIKDSHGITIEAPNVGDEPPRPSNVRHVSTPAYESPLRHHRRISSAHRPVKETLHARSEYTNSEDDGAAVLRINQYVIKQEIGRGSFGAVHLAVDQHGQEYAVKEFSKSRLRKRAQSNILRRPHSRPRPGHLAARMSFNSPLSRRSAGDGQTDPEQGPLYLIREEIAIMKKLNHHNLVSLIEVLDDPNEDSLYMVLEMCKKGVVMKVGVNEKADPYDPESCRCWFRDLILGIEYLHAQGVVHRDIKPDNLLLTDDDVLKIVDFGVSEMFEKTSDMMTAKSAGSPAFLPPELCKSKHGDISGKAADVWSMGVTLYCLHFGRIPFEKMGPLDLYESIREDTPDIPEGADPQLVDLLHRLLEKDPSKRITIPELREHPWVTKDRMDPLLSAEENTAEIVEPPTEEELNKAITGNLSNLLVVMKAVKKFKSLLANKRPYLMSSILGRDIRIVQAPLNIDSEVRPRAQKTRSLDTFNRRAVESALVTEGVHRNIDDDDGGNNPMNRPFLQRNDTAVAMGPPQKRHDSGDNKTKSGPDDFPRDLHAKPSDHKSTSSTSTSDAAAAAAPHFSPPQKSHTFGPGPGSSSEHHKGQAHNPLDEYLFLDVGPFSSDQPPDPPAVSESPHAAEDDIYEKAYHEEIERIRSNSGREGTTLYLTRRVDGKKEYEEDEGLIGVDRGQEKAKTGFARILEKVRRKDGERDREGDGGGDGEDNGD